MKIATIANVYPFSDRRSQGINSNDIATNGSYRQPSYKVSFAQNSVVLLNSPYIVLKAANAGQTTTKGWLWNSESHIYMRTSSISTATVAISSRSARELSGEEVKVDSIDLGQAIDPDYYDFYFVGGGQDKQQIVIAEDLLKKADSIKAAVNGGAVLLSVCGGYQLLGHYYKPHEGPELKGISLIDAYTVAGNRRMIGNVIIKREDSSTLVGFENHSGKTFLGKDVPALGKIVVGNGNNGEDKMEGAAAGTVYGTYLHGSLLPKNPAFADQILAQALTRRFGSVNLAPLDDTIELNAHKRALTLPA